MLIIVNTCTHVYVCQLILAVVNNGGDQAVEDLVFSVSHLTPQLSVLVE